MSLVNADKPELSRATTMARVDKFQAEEFPVLLTREALFQGKVKSFRGASVNFIVGMDTFLRLVDVKYYHGSIGQMNNVISEDDHRFRE
eukprot:Trichotokara_eunicae@DN2370_c0_g1_i1.p1